MRTIFCLLAIAGLLCACRKQSTHTLPGNLVQAFPRSAAEKTQVDLHQEILTVLQEVYQDPAALREVNAAIYSGYYEDERVLLKDLLWPETSALYQSGKRPGAAPTGIFSRRFREALDRLDCPLLQAQLSATAAASIPNASGSVLPAAANAWQWPVANTSIYFPYSAIYPISWEEEQPQQSPTLVAADREADAGPGRQPYRCGARICYRPTIVNDDYASRQPTHIITPGATINQQPVIAATPTKPAKGSLIFLGQVRCVRQYDRLISFTGNGGGSELKFIRGNGFLRQNADGHITAPANTVSVYLSRQEIRKKKWKTVSAIWDANWLPDNKEQVFGIYEEDTEGSRTFSGSIVTKIKSLTIEPISYSFTVQTNDEIIRQLAWDRNSFFTYNQGKLQNGCMTDDQQWTIYDCLTPVSYTLPQQ
ncbi:MAG: hypothetical protein P0Y53_06970 [Candidatus Pseudobacter hemicellulosilyticus]|uniref:Uncharacterized protein n=1 Tax=Candidatus Pseudobacter hemicellulosilyticus TaxID=3121375 RepID=A0AAJ6BIF7_9BACT|nr:MAG: hypothetical protein P0Y53_06970 [Pseudobacter sp.]